MFGNPAISKNIMLLRDVAIMTKNCREGNIIYDMLMHQYYSKVQIVTHIAYTHTHTAYL